MSAGYKTGAELIAEAKGRVQEISPAEAIQVAADAVVLDVREGNEWNLGHIPGAVHIPRGVLEGKVEGVIERAGDRMLIVYCASGNRSALAAETLGAMGYSNVVSLAGGFRGWVEGGGEIAD